MRKTEMFLKSPLSINAARKIKKIKDELSQGKVSFLINLEKLSQKEIASVFRFCVASSLTTEFVGGESGCDKLMIWKDSSKSGFIANTESKKLSSKLIEVDFENRYVKSSN